MIKYINMQTSLCPRCKSKGVIARCSKQHLEKAHEYKIEDPYEVIKRVTDLMSDHRSKKQNQRNYVQITRKDRLEYAENIIQPNLDKLKLFLNN